MSTSPSKPSSLLKEDKDIDTGTTHVENAKILDEIPVFDDSIEQTKASNAIWLITFTVAMGGFLFGYDTGVISAVLVSLKDDLGHTLSAKEQELITSITSGGALIGALIAGLPADKYGRKFGVYAGCLLFLLGCIIQASAYSVAQMTVGRLVVGLGVGSAAMIIPLYISEIAPATHRGRMIALDNVSITFGQMISYGLGAGLADVPNGWRYMVAVGGIPPIILTLLLPTCPESPRQLLSHDKVEEATLVVRKVFPHATDEQVLSKVENIRWTVHQEKYSMADKTLWWQFKQLHSVPENLRALICACAVMAISQLGGFNTLMYYSATLFALVGFDKPTAVSIVVGATNFVFTFLNMTVIDKMGRRRILLITVIGMSLTLSVTAIAFHWIPVSPSLELASSGQGINWAGILVLVSIIVYIGFYASGCATIGWVGTELLPMEVRALGTMMNTVTCWGCNIIISSTFLSMMQSITPSGAFGVYAGICFVGWLFVVFCYPEANGLPLEDVRQIFAHGFGIKLANRLQKERKAEKKEREARV